MTGQVIHNFLVRDTAEVFIKDRDGREFFFGMNTTAGVTREVSKTLIKGGIGAPVVATLSVDEGYTITADSALYTSQMFELVSGGKFVEGSIEIVEADLDEAGNTVATPKTVDGSMIDLKFGQFPSAVELQLHTVIYDRNTNEIVADLYYVFYKAIPDANFEQSFNMDENNVTTTTFTATKADGKDSYGVYAIIPREGADTETGDTGEGTEGE